MPESKIPAAPRPDPQSLEILSQVLPIWCLSSQSGWFQLALADSLKILAGKLENLKPLYAAFCLMAWQENPLQVKFIQHLRDLDFSPQLLTYEQKLLLAASAWQTPAAEDQALWEDVRHAQEPDLLREFLATVYRDPVYGLYWLAQTWEELFFLNDLPFALELLNNFAQRPGLAQLVARLKAELVWRLGEPAQALEGISGLNPAAFGWWRSLALGNLLAETGQTREAGQLLGALWREIPWHLNLTLRLYDLLNPLNLEPSLLESGDTAVLLYSWNKAGPLQDTLRELAASKLGRTLVVALDNGSRDATPQVLERAAGLFAPGRFETLRLPVNVGAPGARNWLLSLPAVREKSYAAFLDDDALVPEDWLLRLRSLAGEHPRAGALGCAISDCLPPHRLQVADCQLLPREMGQRSLEDISERIFIFNNCAGLAGQESFAYTRPCASVSGCCHLLNMRAVREAGNFDIAYNPSQFDDLDRDLRSWLAGYPSLYHGALRVRHVQSSSLRQAKSEAQIAQILGNKIKLEYKFSDAEVARLSKESQDALWEDLYRKTAWLSAHAR